MSETQTLKKRGYRTFTREQIERALMAVAYANGSCTHASRELAEQGFDLNPKTLWSWKENLHRDLYKEMQEECLPKIRNDAAERHMEHADAAQAVKLEAIAILKGKLHELPPRDLPGAIRNLGVTAAVDRDKARDLRGEATLVTGTDKRNLKDVLRALKGKGLNVDVVDAEVVSEETVEPKQVTA